MSLLPLVTADGRTGIGRRNVLISLWSEIQKYRDADIQKDRDVEVQKYRNTETQKRRNTEIQKHRNTAYFAFSPNFALG